MAAHLPHAILMKMVTFFGLEEVRDERYSQVPRGYGNDVRVDDETISLISNCKGRLVSAQRLASLLPGHPGYLIMQEDMKDFV